MKVTFTLLLFSFITVFVCCKKINPKPNTPKDDLTQLPPETQEGKSTMGFLLNGQVWRNQGYNGGKNLTASYYQRALFISAFKTTNTLSQGMGMHIYRGFKGVGVYNLTTDSTDVTFSGSTNCSYDNLDYTKGTLEITRFDTVNYIVSGRFSFTLAKLGCDTVRITDGRFDIKFSN
jgi:hypothetical protein